jgi:succinate dehydrogenase/fumarate reductase flavoprotein subunit
MRISDPFAVPVEIVFFFPNRRAIFERVDDEFAHVERLCAVSARDRDRDRYFSDPQIARAMHNGNLTFAELLASLRRNALEFRNGHGLVCFVGKARYGASVIRTFANDSLKRNDGSACIGSNIASEFCRIDRIR